MEFKVCLGKLYGDSFIYIKVGNGTLSTTEELAEATFWPMVSMEKLYSGHYEKIKQIVESLYSVELVWLPICVCGE